MAFFCRTKEGEIVKRETNSGVIIIFLKLQKDNNSRIAILLKLHAVERFCSSGFFFFSCQFEFRLWRDKSVVERACVPFPEKKERKIDRIYIFFLSPSLPDFQID